MELFNAPTTTLMKVKLKTMFKRGLRRKVVIIVVDRDTGVVLRTFTDYAVKSELKGSHGLVPAIILLKSKKAMFGELPPQQNLIFLTDTYSGKFITKADLKKEKLDATLSTEEKRIGFDMIRYLASTYQNQKFPATLVAVSMVSILLLFSLVSMYYMHKNIKSQGEVLSTLQQVMQDSNNIRQQEVKLLTLIAKAEGYNPEDIEVENTTAPTI